jgi:hypothetical protein
MRQFRHAKSVSTCEAYWPHPGVMTFTHNKLLAGDAIVVSRRCLAGRRQGTPQVEGKGPGREAQNAMEVDDVECEAEAPSQVEVWCIMLFQRRNLQCPIGGLA